MQTRSMLPIASSVTGEACLLLAFSSAGAARVGGGGGGMKHTIKFPQKTLKKILCPLEHEPPHHKVLVA